MVEIKSFCFNSFQENTFLIYEPLGECMIVDPGCYTRQELNQVINFIQDYQLKPISIVNTHGHIDHVLGVHSLKDKYSIPFYIHQDELPLLRNTPLYAPLYGILDFTLDEPDGFISEGEILKAGSSNWEVILVPGHSPGHIALYEKSLKILIAGDILFRNSIGRSDLPGGNHEQLVQGIRSKLFNLPEEVEVFPGHGPSTFIGEEKINNPFCGWRV